MSYQICPLSCNNPTSSCDRCNLFRIWEPIFHRTQKILYNLNYGATLDGGDGCETLAELPPNMVWMGECAQNDYPPVNHISAIFVPHFPTTDLLQTVDMGLCDICMAWEMTEVGLQ